MCASAASLSPSPDCAVFSLLGSLPATVSVESSQSFGCTSSVPAIAW